ncbi:MAG: AGE family epimerase/isomerase [Alphaproteobacteria bacterium]
MGSTTPGPESRPSGDLASQTMRFRAWLVDHALPMWSTDGVDGQGGFIEQFDLNGRPEPDVVRRIRVQARQIYVFSQATLLGLGDYRDLVRAGVDWLVAHGWDGDEGGFFHRLAGSGEPADTAKDTYDHAFILFGLAHAMRILPDAKVTGALERTLSFVEARLVAPDGVGFLEGVPAKLPRRQNPHMHLLEAFLAIHDATGDARHLTSADRIVEMFRTRFFNPVTETLTEFFTDDWAPAGDGAGDIVEPGHHFEWTYLLHAHAAAHAPRERHAEPGAEANQVFEVALARGLDPVSGLAYDEIWREGGVKSATKRCWAQTEALRAHALMARHSPVLAPRAAAFVDRLFRFYLDPAPRGGWLDVMGPDNQPTAKAIPASTLYHLMSAYAFIAQDMDPDVDPQRARPS